MNPPTNSDMGIFIICMAIVIGLVASIISIASYFATRREVDDLKIRVEKLENDIDQKTERIHKRVTRLLAGQMLIAGRVGCELESRKDQLGEIIQRLDSDENL